METELIKIYLGNKYEYFTTSEFNKFNFLMPIFYMLYKGMFVYGTIWTILIVVLIKLFHENLLLLFTSILLLNLFISFNFNSLYIDFVNDNIKKILKKKSFEEAKQELEHTKPSSDLIKDFIKKIVIFIISFILLIIVLYLVTIAAILLFFSGKWEIMSSLLFLIVSISIIAFIFIIIAIIKNNKIK